MLRKIITINEDLCDGCGECVTSCAEGALQIVDGKARLVKEDFCDGFGDCVGTCPTGALTIETKESKPFDFDATREYLRETEGENAVERLEAAHERHQDDSSPKVIHGAGCPGSAAREIKRGAGEMSAVSGPIPTVNRSELRQWPVQIHLVQPGAPYFSNSELVVMNTCGPIASADVHWRYLRNRSVVVGCPKLDHTEPYASKIGAILSEKTIPRVIVVRMEVPCCGGLTKIVLEAVRISGRSDIIVQEDTITLDGSISSRILQQPGEQAAGSGLHLTAV